MNKSVTVARKLHKRLDETALRIQLKLAECRGASDFAAVMVLIVIVVVLGVTVFYPQLESLLKTLFSGASDKITSLFDKT